MKQIFLIVVFGLTGLLSLSTLSSCNNEHDEKNLPVEEVLPLPEEEVLPFEVESGLAPDESGVAEENSAGLR
jgi:hypothetical protein